MWDLKFGMLGNQALVNSRQNRFLFSVQFNPANGHYIMSEAKLV